jgi:ssDNA thymidine ADP-ribosyltransferase, DarT
MLYGIWKGYNNVIQRPQRDIVYLVSNFDLIEESNQEFVFFDGHGVHILSECYNNKEKFENIDWKIVKNKFWNIDEKDPDRKRRKQAEFLVHRELSIEYLIGIGVFDKEVKNKIDSILKKINCNLNCKVKKDWYY